MLMISSKLASFVGFSPIAPVPVIMIPVQHRSPAPGRLIIEYSPLADSEEAERACTNHSERSSPAPRIGREKRRVTGPLG
jgi:hypothetical protein